MKIILSHLFLFAIGSLNNLSTAQIIVNDYSKEVRCEVQDLGNVPAVVAHSSAGDVVTQLSETTFSGGCLGTLVRTYSFSDKAGNSASAEQFIFLSDSVAPLLTGVPEDTFARPSEIPKPALVQSTDNSGRAYQVFFSEVATTKETTRTWTCTDDCGNTTQAKQVIRMLK